MGYKYSSRYSTWSAGAGAAGLATRVTLEEMVGWNNPLPIGQKDGLDGRSGAGVSRRVTEKGITDHTLSMGS